MPQLNSSHKFFKLITCNVMQKSFSWKSENFVNLFLHKLQFVYWPLVKILGISTCMSGWTIYMAINLWLNQLQLLAALPTGQPCLCYAKYIQQFCKAYATENCINLPKIHSFALKSWSKRTCGNAVNVQMQTTATPTVLNSLRQFVCWDQAINKKCKKKYFQLLHCFTHNSNKSRKSHLIRTPERHGNYYRNAKFSARQLKNNKTKVLENFFLSNYELKLL